ncbi:hypothetical protein Tco_0386216 [Tanacetum coccineum]
MHGACILDFAKKVSFRNYVGLRLERKVIDRDLEMARTYRLDFPEELDGVHDTFNVSNLNKCLADPTLQVTLDEIQVDAKLNFVKEPMEILEKEFKKLKRSRITIVKVRWNSKCGPEFAWERKDQMKLKLEEEKACRRGKVYNRETATYGKIWDNEDVHDLESVETEFPAMVFNNTLASEAALSCEPTVSSLNNDEIDFRISFDESDDEDCTEPSERNNNVGGVFINLEISKCWSLKIPRRLFNKLFAHELNLENHS